MRIQVNSAVFSVLCLGMLLSCVTSSQAMDEVIKKTNLVVTQGNEGSTSGASTYSAGDNVTLKEWESGATTLDGSGNTNMQVDVTGGPIVYQLDPAYGDPIVAVDVRRATEVLVEILGSIFFGL